ncbi:YbjN domain-containing protein [candidate division WOR-3 bacterium]|nr:YbjN domain-containing protein [candidate division WOR-3 bacterium]
MRLARIKKGLGRLLHDEHLIDGFIEELKAEILGKESTEAVPAWVFKYGSAHVVVSLRQVENKAMITFAAPIIDIPKTKQKEFYRELLERNARSGGAYFVIDSTVPDTVLLEIARPAEGLDYVEFKNCLDTVGNMADLYDDELKRKYSIS